MGIGIFGTKKAVAAPEPVSPELAKLRADIAREKAALPPPSLKPAAPPPKTPPGNPGVPSSSVDAMRKNMEEKKKALNY